MIFEKDNKKLIEKNNETPKVHIKTASQDLSNSSNHSNIYLTKLINQNILKNESLINDSLPNLKKNIQNIFANEEKKEKAFRYLIQKNKDCNKNSRDTKKAIKTPEIKPYRKIEMQTKRIISPYNNKNFYSFKPVVTNYNITKSFADLREPNYIRKNYINNTIYRYSVNTQKYISEDEPFNQNDFYKGNQFRQNDNNTYTDILNNNNNMNINRNRGNKFEHISIYNTYNNTFNNYRMQKNDKVKKNVVNQTYDYVNLNNLRNTLNDKSSLEKNPYKDYMKSSNLSNIKKKILDNNKENIIIDISDNENYIKEKDIKKNNYVKRVKNERIKVQKNENLIMKKNPTKMNDSTISRKPNNNYYYIHKNLGPKILYQKKNDKNRLNQNLNTIKIEDNNSSIEEKKSYNIFNNTYRKENNNSNSNSNNKTYEKRKNYYDIYGHKDIQVHTIDNKKKYENENKNDDDKKIGINVNTIKVNIDKNILKNYSNSPLSNRYNKYFIDNRNKLINKNKKIYEKRETIQRSPKQNYEQLDNYKNKAQTSVFAKNDINPLNAKNKYVFNDEEEIIEYIKKKYNKRNVEEIINRGNTNNNKNLVYKPKNENKYMGLMTTEEVKKIKQKNEELSSQIKNLKFENKQYKKELNDMKNKFNDLSKEIDNIKENK